MGEAGTLARRSSLIDDHAVIRPELKDALLSRGFFRLQIIWSAIIAAVLCLGVVAWAVPAPAGAAPPAPLIGMLYAAAFSCASASLFLRRILLSKSRMFAARQAGHGAGGVGVEPTSDEERSAVTAFFAYQTGSIVLWALSESVAIFGLVASLLFGSLTHFAVLSASALVLLGVVHAPSRAAIEDFIKEIEAR